RRLALPGRHPRVLARALLTSPDQLCRSAYILLFRREGTAERLLTDDGGRRLRGIFDGTVMSDGEVDRYVAPMLEPGALMSALSWYRAMSLGWPSTGPVPVPTAYVCSDGDTAPPRGRAAVR